MSRQYQDLVSNKASFICVYKGVMLPVVKTAKYTIAAITNGAVKKALSVSFSGFNVCAYAFKRALFNTNKTPTGILLLIVAANIATAKIE